MLWNTYWVILVGLDSKSSKALFCGCCGTCWTVTLVVVVWLSSISRRSFWTFGGEVFGGYGSLNKSVFLLCFGYSTIDYCIAATFATESARRLSSFLLKKLTFYLGLSPSFTV